MRNAIAFDAQMHGLRSRFQLREHESRSDRSALVKLVATKLGRSDASLPRFASHRAVNRIVSSGTNP